MSMDERDPKTERDPAISGLWKAAHHPEPPAELDQRILAVARQAVACPAPRRQGWWRLAVPFSATAVLVLAVTLLLRIERETPERMRDASVPQLAQAPRMAAAEGRPELPPGASAAAPAKAQPERKELTAGSAKREMDADQPAPAEVLQADALPPSATASASRESDRQDALASQPAAESVSPLQAAPRTESPELGKARAARVLEAGPEQSVQRIRALLRAGQRETALQVLAELRRRHPDFALPPDLASLP